MNLIKSYIDAFKLGIIFQWDKKIVPVNQVWLLNQEQVTRGHNIVADGWAGASNPHPHPMPPHQHTYPKKYLKRSFFHFSTRGLRTDGQSLL